MSTKPCDGCVIEPTQTEQRSWEAFRAATALTEIAIPYGPITLGAVVIVGVFHLKEPLDSSSTDGVVAGAVSGTYHLDKNGGQVSLFDPTKNLLRVDVVLSFADENLKARLCTRRLDGRWRCGDYVVLATW
jgi:hypothetical protein